MVTPRVKGLQGPRRGGAVEHIRPLQPGPCTPHLPYPAFPSGTSAVATEDHLHPLDMSWLLPSVSAHVPFCGPGMLFPASPTWSTPSRHLWLQGSGDIFVFLFLSVPVGRGIWGLSRCLVLSWLFFFFLSLLLSLTFPLLSILIVSVH